MHILRRSRPDGKRVVVVGLGNPGERYARTRHNAGALTLDVLVARIGGSLKRHKSGCLVAEGALVGEKCVLARPTSFMNESGRQVRAVAQWYKSGPQQLVVVHDELDIPFGDVRVKKGGGSAGHNGLSSLITHLGTKDFTRVRVGIGRPPGRQEPADFVLAPFSSSERRELPAVLEDAADAVEKVIEPSGC